MEGALLDRDWRFIIDTLYQLALADTIDHTCDIYLQSVDALIGANQTMINLADEYEGNTPSKWSFKYVGDEPRYLDAFIKGNYFDDPYFKYWLLADQTTIFRDTDILGDEYRMNTKTYRDIYSKQGIHYALRACLVYKRKSIAMINCFNSKQRGDFSSRDAFILTSISPHFALKLGQLMEGHQLIELKEIPQPLCEKYGLTTREAEIVMKIISGSTDEEIADSLYISQATVRKHIYNIYKKTDVNRRAQLFPLFTTS